MKNWVTTVGMANEATDWTMDLLFDSWQKQDIFLSSKMSWKSLGLLADASSMHIGIQCLRSSAYGVALTTYPNIESTDYLKYEIAGATDWKSGHLVSYLRRSMLEHTRPEGQGGHWEIVLSVIYITYSTVFY